MFTGTRRKRPTEAASLPAKNNPGFNTVLILLSGAAVLAYIATKAAVSSFTHDESYTYLHYISQSFLDIISNQGAYSNNHVLNTLAMKYSEKLFGSSELALRLPNLLALTVFLCYSFLLTRKLHPGLCASIFILAVTNTTLIDFFGLARGYGLSIAFMVMGLYHLVESFNANRQAHLVVFNLAALLAILSNFTMLTFYLSALLVFNIVHVLDNQLHNRKKVNFFKVNAVNLILFVFLFIVLYEPVRKAVKFNSFDFGGKQGFVSDTVTSLILHLFTNIHFTPVMMAILQTLIVVLFLLPIALLVMKSVRGGSDFITRHRPLIIINLVLAGISAASIIQHWVLKTDFLVGRFSLFLVPLLIFNLGFLFNLFIDFRAKSLVITISVALTVLSSANFYINRNLYSCAEWSYDSGTKDAVATLRADYGKVYPKSTDRVQLGIHWLFEPTINFYRQTWKLDWLNAVDRNGLKGADNYIYIFRQDTVNVPWKSWATIFKCEGANTLLIKKL